MSPERRDDGGIPRSRQRVPAPPGGASREERWPGANDAKAEKLQGRSLRRQAAAQGLEIRHSAYGYALIDSERKPIDDRNNMSLEEISALLNPAPEQ